jgi:hypothetical protein
MAKLTDNVIQKYLPTLAKKLSDEGVVANQKPIIGSLLNHGRTPARYRVLVDELNRSSASSARRIIAKHRDLGATLSKREEQTIVRLLKK